MMQWLKDAKQPADLSSTRPRPFVVYEPLAEVIPDVDLTEQDYSHVVSDDFLKRWCDTVFSQGFEASFGLTLGRYGCPFVYA
jgi:hypothetical protein